MTSRLIAAATIIGVMTGGSIGTASAADDLFAGSALSEDELSDERGGADLAFYDLNQVNSTNSTGTNENNSISNGSGVFQTGVIHPSSMADNSGITTLMQNTGNVVNMNYNMSVNVHMQ